MRALLGILAVALAACSAPETSRRVATEVSLPPMKTFGRVTPARTRATNAELARDFLELSFQLENGAPLAALTRFEGPITVKVSGKAPSSLQPDLTRLLERLRREARIDITQVTSDEPASIVIEPVRRAQIASAAPTAACFVRPHVTGWSDYRRKRNDPETFWTNLKVRRQMAIFLPRDVSPQEVRDCLHEEIGQALGPLNDIYRLEQSIFNDDNFHSVLTSYDMLILRAYYDRSLENGMSAAEVAARLPAIFSRLNPAGRRVGGIAPAASNAPGWQAAIDRATRPGMNRARQAVFARQAVQLARAFGPADTRLAFSHYVLGRLTLGSDPEEALRSFIAAGRIYQRAPTSKLQEAHIAVQIAAFQLSAGLPDAALGLVEQNLDAARRAEHAALLSLLLLVKSQAELLIGNEDASRAAEREALAWARYGFGSDREVAARVREIRAISPRPDQGNPA